MKNLLFTGLMLLGSVVIWSQELNIEDLRMQNSRPGYGIEGRQAPELKVNDWVGPGGEATEPIRLADYQGKFVVIYGFQAWCPGCHSRGLPALQKMTKALEGNDKVAFMAIQTVFEGAHANTRKRMIEIQEEYQLDIPFGHDTGKDSERGFSLTMQDYRTGGTPWFIFIDQKGRVVFNDFHMNTEKAIEYLSAIE